MRIACPSCAAAYEVPDQLATPGRRTRCARCGHQWVAIPLDADLPPAVPLDPTPPDEPDTGEPEAEVPPPRRRALPAKAPPPPDPPKGRTSLRIAWAVTLALLVGSGVVGVLERRAIMNAWPPSARLYAALGLAGAVAPEPHAPMAPKRDGDSRVTDPAAASSPGAAGSAHGSGPPIGSGAPNGSAAPAGAAHGPGAPAAAGH